MSKLIPISLIAVYLTALYGCSTLASNSVNGFRNSQQINQDQQINQTASINLLKLDTRFAYSRVNVNSFFGAVLLTGQVADSYLKQLAEDSIKALPNVSIVHNYLTVGDKPSYNQIVQDNLISANIKSNLKMIVPPIMVDQIDIKTENTVVYIMGRLTQPQIDRLVSLIQQTPNVVKLTLLVDTLSSTGAIINPTINPFSMLSSNDGTTLNPTSTATFSAPLQQPPPEANTNQMSENKLNIKNIDNMPYMPDVKPLN